MNGIALVVVVIAQASGDPMTVAFERAARGVLGEQARIDVAFAAEDPPDDESAARAVAADGVVELSWTAGRARIHCYLSREQRWVDREISFGGSDAQGEREEVERGRLLGLAVATMFSEESVALEETEAPPKPPEPPPREPTLPLPVVERRPVLRREPGRSLEFAGTASSGVAGTAAGLGAVAGLRLGWTGPLWLRLFVGGRSGNIPQAQATTRALQLGGGLALAAWPEPGPLELGVRFDAFASYFEASHLSEDDAVSDRRSRWLPGGDLMAEAGYRFAGNAGLFTAAGVEGVLGRTDIYTHGQRVAVVPPLRLLAELGFRSRF